MLELTTFWVLFGLTLASATRREWIFSRTSTEWLIDTGSLLLQGFVIPACQYFLAMHVFPNLFPNGRGILQLAFIPSLLLNLIAVDYLYYWNHRLLHTKTLWPLHQLHHSAQRIDVYMTSRNHILTSFFIVYVWVNGILGFLLASPKAFFWGASITAALDLWRHSNLAPTYDSRLHRWLRVFLITPHEHGLHHATGEVPANFGANFSWWDRIHGTFASKETPMVANEPIEWREFLIPRKTTATT